MVINQATIHIISCFFRNCKPYFARGRESADLPGTYAFARADAAMRCSALYDRGSWAGAMSRLAGCSSGRSVCARGGWSARRCGALRSDALAGISVQSSLHYGRWRLQGRFVRSMFRALCGDACVWRAEMRFCWGARRSYGSIEAFCVRSRRSCGSIEVFCVRSRRSAVLSKCFAFNHACCLPHSAKQDGLRNVAFLFRHGSGSPFVHSRILGSVIELYRFTSCLYVS